VVRPNQEKPSHLKIEDQSHLVLANRGSQGRITPDRKRGMRYAGISPFLSIVRQQDRSAFGSTLPCQSARKASSMTLDKTLDFFIYKMILERTGHPYTRGTPSCSSYREEHSMFTRRDYVMEMTWENTIKLFT
jgi:hypothetical protein